MAQEKHFMVNPRVSESLKNINQDWLIYADKGSRFLDYRDFSPIPPGTCVGIHLSNGKDVEEDIFFKYVFIPKKDEDPELLNEARRKAYEYMRREGSLPDEVNDIDPFLVQVMKG